MAEQKQRVVWVVGHKNPDTDSICAAIAYADLKNKSEDGVFLPKKAGNLNQETRYVLDRFGVQEPKTISDVGAQLKDINYRRSEGVSEHITLKKAWELMRQLDVVTMPVVNENRHLEGLITNSDIAYSYMDILDNRILSRAGTQYKNIVETIQGTLQCGNPHARFTKGKVVVATGNRDAMRREIEQDDLVVVGNIRERQMIVLERDAACIVICGENQVDEEVLRLARQQECVLITTEYDAFTTARLIHQSIPIRFFMTKDNIISFQLDDYVDYVQDVMASVRHRDFPILDEQRRFVGMLSRRYLLNTQKKQVILVDHNEQGQAVDGIKDTEVIEIIDHHRIHPGETMNPIYFRNQPLGCTATIITMMYQENGVEIPPAIAGLLCSAILSDTLMFRSPTCTPVDQAMARNLAKIAGINMEAHASAMFSAASQLQDKTPDEIFHIDCKRFQCSDKSIAVAQVTGMSKEELKRVKEEMLPYLKEALPGSGMDMLFLLLTNILEQSPELRFAGTGARDTVSTAFPSIECGEESILLPGVVSRKKQLIGPLMSAIEANGE